MKIKNDQGQEIDVLTPEEVEVKLREEVGKKLDEAKQGWEKESGQKLVEVQNKLNEMEKEKFDLETKLISLEGAGEGRDHPNFKLLKEALDKKDQAIKELGESVNNLKTQRESDFLSVEIKKIVGGDEELAKTLKHHYNETLKSMPNSTREEINARLIGAKKLAGVIDAINPMDMVGHGGGHFNRGGSGGGQVVELSTKEKELGKKLGITDEDIKKYGPKLKVKYE